jgi:hypothetical protein
MQQPHSNITQQDKEAKALEKSLNKTRQNIRRHLGLVNKDGTEEFTVEIVSRQINSYKIKGEDNLLELAEFMCKLVTLPHYEISEEELPLLQQSQSVLRKITLSDQHWSPKDLS